MQRASSRRAFVAIITAVVCPCAAWPAAAAGLTRPAATSKPAVWHSVAPLALARGNVGAVVARPAGGLAARTACPRTPFWVY